MNTLADPSEQPVEQYRQLLTAYTNEVNLGNGMDSYEGPHPEDPNRTVDYLHFGRVAFVYMTKEEDEIAYYNLQDRTWEQADTGLALEMRQAIRMANGEATQDLVVVPLKLIQ